MFGIHSKEKTGRTLFAPDVEVNVKNCQVHELKALHVTGHPVANHTANHNQLKL